MLTVTGKQLISAPVASPDVPASMREYLNLAPGVDSDSLLSAFFLRAASIVENRTGITVLPCTYKLYFSGDGSRIRLPLFPAVSASSLSAADSGSVPPESFTLSPAPGYFWELVFSAPVSGAFSVLIEAGYKSPEICPEAARGAIFAIAADLYEHREAESEGSLTESRTVKMALDSIAFLHAGGV